MVSVPTSPQKLRRSLTLLLAVLYGLGVIVVIVLLPGGLASMTTAFRFRRAGAR